MQRNVKSKESRLRVYVDGRRSTVGFTRDGYRPKSDVLGEEESIRRLNFRGGNVILSGVDVEPTLVPRLSRPDYGHMVYVTGTSYYEEIETLLSKFCVRNSRQWHNYAALHVAKRQQREDGRGDYEVVRNVEPPYVPPNERSWSEKQNKKNPGVKKYTLAQFFSDTYLQDKYGLSASFRRDVQMVAISRPADAAATVQDALQRKSPGVKILVTAAGYDTTRQRSAATIRDMAWNKPIHHASIETEVIGQKMLMYGPEGRKGWFVCGPLRNAESVSDVHRLVCHAGMHETIFLFSLETQVLGIDVYDGVHCISPTIIGHVKAEDEVLPYESHPETLEKLTDYALDRLRFVVKNVRMVEGRTGMLASAVQVDPRMVLLNNHVKQFDETASVAGQQLVGGVPVSQDLWMQKVAGVYEPWNFRAADIGEDVAILYHNGERPVLSAPFRVDQRSGFNVYSARNNEIVAGMSGGALVSLRDMAMLGLHCGTTLRHLFAVEFTNAMHLDLIEMLSTDDSGMAARKESADAVYAQLRARGCGKQFVNSVQRLMPLYDMVGMQVGSALAFGEKVWSTVPVGLYKTDGDVFLDFTAHGGLYSCTDNVDDELQSPLSLQREPQLHERVVIVGAGSDGHYVSQETHVRQVGAGRKTFMLNATEGNVLPLSGGLVISVQDGAALGQYVRDSTSEKIGKWSLCVTFPTITREPVNSVHLLSRVFPMLHVTSWDPSLLAEALRHTSAMNIGLEALPSYRSLAAYGDALMRQRLYFNLYKAGVPLAEWSQYLLNLHSGERLSGLCWDLGLSQLLNTAVGVSLPAQSDGYADLMRALVAAISMSEEASVLDLVLSIIGAVPTVEDLMGPSAEYGRMMRRPSELGLPTVSSDTDIKLLTPVD